MTPENFSPSNTTAAPDVDDSLDNLHQSFNIISIAVFSLVSVLGVLGNGVVIWVTGCKMKKTVNTVWYLHLAVADFIFAAFLPLSVTSLTLGPDWHFGNFMCMLKTTLISLNMFASVYILVVTSVDRCVSVVWPVWAQNHRNVCNAFYVGLCVWVVALILNSHFFFFHAHKDRNENTNYCFSKFFFEKATPSVFQPVVITPFLLRFAVPFTVIVSCYAAIIHRLRRNHSLASQSSRPFKVITSIIVAFFLCWTPYHIIQLMVFIPPNEKFNYAILIGIFVAKNLVVLHCCLNPLLYVFLRQDFKDEIRKSILHVLESAFQEEETRSPSDMKSVNTRQSREKSDLITEV
ncbi:LOW QUALITY PROTEIN: chemokine-like receptor 1 [Oreochromis niloticus]|uniref:LOW QUALITY PROTEIN: chemokine-like receptor 1 n=1 Tax=Oreochromis niloticus TaxID=8128 RepID=UPI000DF49AC4|nr:LOW QUALITY PROTEIN: chemokine-like receptor 1 [Oreochromis niloticus]